MSVAAPGQGMRSRTGPPMMFSTAAMKIGDLVLYQGRLYYLRGLTGKAARIKERR